MSDAREIARVLGGARRSGPWWRCVCPVPRARACRALLLSRVLAVAEHLLPRGVLDGKDWCVGSIAGEPGKSLKVCVRGPKAGLWADFAAGGESGDLIDLWQLVKRLSLVAAVDEIRSWLGIAPTNFEKREKVYRRPEKPKGAAPRSAVLDYLAQEDLNECLKAGIAADEIRHCFEAARSLDPPELVRAGAFADDVVNLFWPSGDREPGYRLPWRKVADRLVFRPAELTLWTGATVAGKSQALSHALVDMGEQGARVCIASLEMVSAQVIRRMVKQAGNVDRPTEPYTLASDPNDPLVVEIMHITVDGSRPPAK